MKWAMGEAHGETESGLGSWMRGVVYKVYSLDYGFMLKRSLEKNKTGDSFKWLVNKNASPTDAVPTRKRRRNGDGHRPTFLRYATLICCPSVTHCSLCIFPAALPTRTEAMHCPIKTLPTFLWPKLLYLLHRHPQLSFSLM